MTRPRPVFVCALVGVVCAVLGYSVRPEPDVHTEYVFRYVDRVRVEERIVKVGAERKRTERVKESKPDGSTIEREITTSSSANLEALDLSLARDVASLQQGKHTETRARANWRAGILVGASLREWQPLYGGRVERRIIGDVWGGAWGLSSGSGGVSVSVDF